MISTASRELIIRATCRRSGRRPLTEPDRRGLSAALGPRQRGHSVAAATVVPDGRRLRKEPTMTRTRLLAALVAGLALAGAGTAATALADDPASPAALVPARTAADTTSATVLAGWPTTGPTADDAGRTAVGHLGGGIVVEVEREVEHGRTAWDVDVRRGAATTRVHVDAATGAVTRVEPGRDDRPGSRSTADRRGWRRPGW
jgi:hypothetical protein